MPTYKKLVRDRIPDVIRSNGEEPVTHVASPLEYRDALRRKIQEEVDEYLDSSDPHELADIMEVVFALGQLDGLSPLQLQMLRLRKRISRGGFEGRVILDTVAERSDPKNSN
jgi:predicted house-cleaning noncanonical NTP pyrophosphatase (MazG superfamily)